ncbi:uncharacterized protein MELLADRAFT_95431 [Melampsora larici-populina 98AG31]|uniref:Uncharacterized protein n=1 Tax=Melampsora larici-populina (strain 98AG31 / pathotype 3-4-7) TaxID=747676 RepID=F4S9A6_MELLP|nr:uncharacterized protein MELLADRAFT_95431 [Melampsora larici-populina 98AG31]EGF98786.1 hypothetical protein MELLADRAFT_95431 [Melampsora larici-populina 98AG31]
MSQNLIQAGDILNVLMAACTGAALIHTISVKYMYEVLIWIDLLRSNCMVKKKSH